MRRICKSNGKKIKMKILQYYKCYGLKETLKKIKRYSSYMSRFKRNKEYYRLSNQEKKYITLKTKSINIIANSSDYDKLAPLINILNVNGYKINYCLYDNIYLTKPFLNIAEQTKYCEYKENSYLTISYKQKINKNIYTITENELIDEEHCNRLYEKIAKNEHIQLPFKSLISIIVLNYNNKNIIFNCINSIIKHSSKYNYELIIVDNNSNDGSYEELLKVKNIKVIKNKKNGCSSGRNLGIKNSSGEYLLFLDSDQYPQNDYWLDEYIDIIKTNKNAVIGWAAGWLNNQHYSGKTVDFYEYRYMPPVGLFRKDIAYLGTGGMFGKKSTFLKTSLFDEAYDPTCYEDTDMSFQLKDNNIELIYSPCLGIIHDAHQTTKSGTKKHQKLIDEKGYYFKNKWSKINVNLLRNGVK